MDTLIKGYVTAGRYMLYMDIHRKNLILRFYYVTAGLVGSFWSSWCVSWSAWEICHRKLEDKLGQSMRIKVRGLVGLGLKG